MNGLVIQCILIVLFLTVSIPKIIGSQRQVDLFHHLQLPQWLRLLTGWLEFIGVVALFIGFWVPPITILAGIWIGMIMIGGCAAHIRAKDPIHRSIPALAIGVSALMMVVFNSL